MMREIGFTSLEKYKVLAIFSDNIGIQLKLKGLHARNLDLQTLKI